MNQPPAGETPAKETPARETRAQHDRRRLRLARLQADLAYFQARLGLIGVPKTLNQAAQRRAFKVLYQQLAAARGRGATT